MSVKLGNGCVDEIGRRTNCDVSSSSVPRVHVSSSKDARSSDHESDPLLASDPTAIRHGRWSATARPVAYTMPVRDVGATSWGGKRDQLRRAQTETEIVVAECSVCLEEYDYGLDSRIPRSLVCGHTFCTRMFILMSNVFLFCLVG